MSAAKNSSTAVFADSPAVRVLRGIYPGVSRIAPSIAARLALRLFLTPQNHKTPQWERPHAATAELGRVTSGGKPFQTYSWGNGDKVIVLCHSWGGRATQLAPFIPRLTELGFRVIGFDAPAHGRSGSGQTDMMEYSDAIGAVVSRFSPVYGILGHSFGAGNALFAEHRFGFEIEKMALIGCFSHAIWVTERFGEILGIPGSTIESMRKLLEDRYNGQLDWEQLDIGKFARTFKGDLLFVHDTQDQEIPYFHVERLLEASGRSASSLLTTTGLGHRRVLRSQTVIDGVSRFFTEPAPSARA